MKGFIYKHTSPSGKGYIGQTTRLLPNDRWRSGTGYKSQSLFNKAIQKYGWENFTHEILWEGEFNDISFLNQLEEDYIIKENTLAPNGYNLRTEGKNFLRSEILKDLYGSANRGKKLSEEHKNKISKSCKGKCGGWNKGLPAWNRGKKRPPHIGEAVSKAHLGKPLQEDHKKKLSESLKNKKWFNNGLIDIRSENCPEGFIPGRINYKRR